MNIPIDKYFKNRAVYKPDSKKYEIDEVDFDDLMDLVKSRTEVDFDNLMDLVKSRTEVDFDNLIDDLMELVKSHTEVDFDDLMDLVKRKTKHLEKWDPLDRKVVSESW